MVVIGAGQAGLSAGYHLRRRGFVPAPLPDDVPLARLHRAARATRGPGEATGGGTPHTYLVLDAEDGPGGAWRHRWRSLRMATVNGIHDLPGMTQPDVDPAEPSADALPRYFADYEQTTGLAVLRPVRVATVSEADDGRLRVAYETGTGERGEVLARWLVNATGTWTRPFWPRYPGQDSFRGLQLHVADYVRAEDFAGKHVVVVGGGISAVQLLDEISRVTTTTWVTRREPEWRDADFDRDAGRRAVALVEERVRQGLPPRSVVSVTGLIWTPTLIAARDRGALVRQPMFTAMEQEGVRMADGSFVRADVVLWATGFRAALDHLRPLHLRGPGGGIVMDGTQVAHDPRVHLIGYGPSSSTVGANRAGREAVNRIVAGIAAAGSRTAVGRETA